MSKIGASPKLVAAVFGGVALYGLTCYSIIGKVPGNHVTILTDRTGRPADHYIFDDAQFYVYNPITRVPKNIRIIPVKKRLVREYLTKDGKNVECVAVIRCQPKIAYAIDIFRAFGTDYGRGFLEKEVSFDIEQVVKKYDYDALIDPERDSDKAIAELQTRVNEASNFFHIEVSEMTLVFRDPLTEDDY